MNNTFSGVFNYLNYSRLISVANDLNVAQFVREANEPRLKISRKYCIYTSIFTTNNICGLFFDANYFTDGPFTTVFLAYFSHGLQKLP